jgi:hypothetical protein
VENIVPRVLCGSTIHVVLQGIPLVRCHHKHSNVRSQILDEHGDREVTRVLNDPSNDKLQQRVKRL